MNKMAQKVSFTILFILLALMADVILPGFFYSLFHLLDPVGFWQILIMIAIGCFMASAELIVVVFSTIILIRFLKDVIWS